MKNWKIKSPTTTKDFGAKDLLALLLYNRGLKSQSQIEGFLHPRYEKLHDAFLFNDMKKAVARILKAIEQKEKIMIYGDYDADGVTSSAIIFKTLQIYGAQVEVFVPHRENDGYGLNIKRITEFIEKKVKLLITVDCGITNINEIAMANENKLDVIVTDHHEPLETLPKAYAIIDPKVKDENYPFRFLSGVAVAYKLASAILEKTKKEPRSLIKWGGKVGFTKWLLDLVAIGTVADVVPLLDENRILVKYGLKVLAQTRRLGLIKLAQVARLDLSKASSYMIGYQLAPRLNAAGRLNHADLAFKLLITEDEKEAEELANELNQINILRQKLTEQAIEQARQQVVKQKNNQMLFVFDEKIQAGIIGLVAGRLCDEYYRPIMVMTKVEEKIVGSGRSIENFNIVETLFANGHLLSRFGGHAQACGFSIVQESNLIIFQENVLKLATAGLTNVDLKPSLEVEAIAQLAEFNLSLIKTLELFEPFGEGNQKPLFVLKNLQVVAMDFLGESAKHLRLMVKEDGNPVLSKLLLFFYKDKFDFEIEIGDRLDAVVEVGLNVWNGCESVEYKIVDMKKVKEDVVKTIKKNITSEDNN